MNTNTTAAVDEVFAALADPIRRRATELLAKRPHRAGELASALGVSPSVMSKHLRVLRKHGLVAESHPEVDARVRIYTLQSAKMRDLRKWLDRAERGWAQQLVAFKDHIEKRR